MKCGVSGCPRVTTSRTEIATIFPTPYVSASADEEFLDGLIELLRLDRGLTASFLAFQHRHLRALPRAQAAPHHLVIPFLVWPSFHYGLDRCFSSWGIHSGIFFDSSVGFDSPSSSAPIAASARNHTRAASTTDAKCCPPQTADESVSVVVAVGFLHLLI